MKLIFISCFFLCFSCAPQNTSKVDISPGPTRDGKYDSEFPASSSTNELARISNVLKKIYNTVTYQNYFFAKSRGITRTSINPDTLKNADTASEYPITVLGTATIIHYLNNKIAVLSCAHIVDKPDTIVSYYPKKDGVEGIVQSIAVKIRQSIVIPDLPGSGEYEILAMDRKNDVAVLGKEFRHQPEWHIQHLEYPFGSSKELDWGSFVYVFGFPRGYQLITRAIVSAPSKAHKGEFFIDAFFNHGMSGSIVLAIRDGIPNFEVVGITKSAAGEDISVLVPEPGQDYEDLAPYEGAMFTKTQHQISYGITMVVSSEVILKLLKDNRKQLRDKGYYIDLPGMD